MRSLSAVGSSDMYLFDPSRPCSSAPHHAKRRWLREVLPLPAQASAASRTAAEPVPLSLMPGPDDTLSRCAPVITTCSGSPPGQSATRLYDVPDEVENVWIVVV